MKVDIKPWNLTDEEFNELHKLAEDSELFKGTDEEFWEDYKEDE